MVEIKITIPNDKLDEFKLGFLKMNPTPTGQTDLQNVKNFLREELLKQYRSGKIFIAQETTPVEINEDTVEV